MSENRVGADKTRVVDAFILGGGSVGSPPSDERAVELLDGYGLCALKASLSSGLMTHDVAYSIGVTVNQLEGYIREHLSPLQRSDLVRQQAAGMVARAHALVMYISDSDDNMALVKAQKDLLLWTARRLDPDVWGRDKPRDDNSDGGFVLNIDINNTTDPGDAPPVITVSGGRRNTEENVEDAELIENSDDNNDEIDSVSKMFADWSDVLTGSPALPRDKVSTSEIIANGVPRPSHKKSGGKLV